MALKDGRNWAASRSSSKQSERSEALPKRTDVKLSCRRAASGQSELLEALITRTEGNFLSMMAPQLLSAAKSRRMGYLVSTKRRIAAIKEVCDEPERKERHELSTMTIRLADAW